jgi:hypothetical protein
MTPQPHEAANAPLRDLERPEETLAAEDAAQVAGGFNPQPDPPASQKISLGQVTNVQWTGPITDTRGTL